MSSLTEAAGKNVVPLALGLWAGAVALALSRPMGRLRARLYESFIHPLTILSGRSLLRRGEKHGVSCALTCLGDLGCHCSAAGQTPLRAGRLLFALALAASRAVLSVD